jgi:hypothetical protein
MSTLDFDKLRKKKQQTSEFDFEAYRNRQAKQEPKPVTPAPLPSQSDILASTLSSVGAGPQSGGLDFKAEQAKKKTYPNVQDSLLLSNNTNAPINSTLKGKLPAAELISPTGGGPANASQIPGVPKTTKEKVFDAIDNVNAFGDRMQNATTFGLTGLVDQMFTKIGPEQSREETQQRIDRSKDAKGGVVADVLGSLVSGDAAFKVGSAAVKPLISKLPSLAQKLTRGVAAGTAFELPRQAAGEVGEYFGGDQQSVPQRLKNVGMSAALGGLTDLGIGAGGMASSAIKNPVLGKAVGGGIGLGSFGAALGAANEVQEAASGQQQSLGGRLADVGKYAAAGAGSGLLGGSFLAKFMRNKGIPEESISEVLALPEGRGTIRQGAAAERSSLSAGTDPIVTPYTPPVGPTTARTGTLNNPYRQKFETLIREAQARQDTFTPGREDLELESLWSQMAEPNDPGLDELITLAYPTRRSPQAGDISKARDLQQQRDVYGIGNPVRSEAERGIPANQPLQAAEPGVLRSQPEPAPVRNVDASMSREVEINNKQMRGEPISQDDIDYILSGQFDQTKLPPEVSSISEQPKVNEPAYEPAPVQQQDTFTDLFGEQNLGISANRSSIRNQGPVTTEDMIVSRSIRNDSEGVGEAVKAQVRAIYQDHVDALDPLKKLGGEVYDTAMDANRANNIANVIVNDKFVNMQGEVMGESLKDIFKKVARGQDKKFLDFMNLKRATTRMKRNERVFDERLGINTVEQVKQRIDTLEERYPGFEGISNDYYNFWNNVRQIGVDEGLISAEMKKALEKSEPFYVPQMRQFSRSEKPGRDFIAKSTKSSLSGQKAPIQRLSEGGSGRPLVDARKSTIEAVGAWTNAVMRNRALQPVARALKENPDAFKGIVSVVDNTANVSKQSIGDINAIIQKDGIEGLINAFDNNFEMVMNKGKNINLDEENILRVMVDGEPMYMRVEDPEVVKAAISMGPQATSLLTDVMGAMSNATKRGATGLLAPVFAVKGATMDLASSAIQARNPVKQAAYTVYSIFSGIGDALDIPGLRTWAQEYRRQGGGYSYALKGERNVNKSIDNLTRYPKLSGRNALKTGKKIVTSPFNILEGIGNIAENAPRIAASRIELERLGGEITPENIRKAMNAGRESTVNYSRKGLKTAEIESIAPYSNAAVQGTRRVLKAFKDNPVRTTAAVGVIAVIPKLIEYSRFHDDEDYKNIPARERMRHTFVSKNADGSFVKVPLDPAYTSFGEMTIEGLRAFKDGDSKAFKGSMDALVNAWTPPMVTGMLQGLTKDTGIQGSLAGLANATVFGPPTSIISNKSFTGAPIVPQSMEDRSGRNQYDEKTSALAKKIGQLTNFSPVMTDYIIKSYGGDAARIGLPLTSSLGQGNVRNTLLRNFITDPTFTNTLSEDFYAAKDKLNEAYANFNEVGEELPEWYNDDLRKALNSSAKDSVSKSLSELRNYKKQITVDKSLNDKERTAKLKEIQEQINNIYIRVNSALSESGVIK